MRFSLSALGMERVFQARMAADAIGNGPMLAQQPPQETHHIVSMRLSSFANCLQNGHGFSFWLSVMASPRFV
jgi:hypothetical protein